MLGLNENLLNMPVFFMVSVFAGKNCSTQLSPCYDNTCINGYCAEAEDGSYRCLCYGGFTGEHCDITIDFCADVDCKNGGTCIQTEEGAFCMCPPQFAGKFLVLLVHHRPADCKMSEVLSQSCVFPAL